MARGKDEPIDQPGPAKGEPRDLTALKRLLVECGPPTFEDAVPGRQVGRGDLPIIFTAAERYGHAYWKQSLTLAHAAYWSMFHERA